MRAGKNANVFGICTVTMFALARIRFWVMLPAAVVAGIAAIGVEIAFIHIEPNVNYHVFATVVLMVVAVPAMVVQHALDRVYAPRTRRTTTPRRALYIDTSSTASPVV